MESLFSSSVESTSDLSNIELTVGSQCDGIALFTEYKMEAMNYVHQINTIINECERNILYNRPKSSLLSDISQLSRKAV
jgi:hypothetical protein